MSKEIEKDCEQNPSYDSKSKIFKFEDVNLIRVEFKYTNPDEFDTGLEIWVEKDNYVTSIYISFSIEELETIRLANVGTIFAFLTRNLIDIANLKNKMTFEINAENISSIDFYVDEDDEKNMSLFVNFMNIKWRNV